MLHLMRNNRIIFIGIFIVGSVIMFFGKLFDFNNKKIEKCYFDIEGTNYKYLKISKGKTNVYFSIEKLDTIIKCEIDFNNIDDNKITIDTFAFIIASENCFNKSKQFKKTSSCKILDNKILRLISTFKMKDKSINKFYLSMILLYTENENKYNIKFDNKICKKGRSFGIFHKPDIFEESDNIVH